MTHTTAWAADEFIADMKFVQKVTQPIPSIATQHWLSDDFSLKIPSHLFHIRGVLQHHLLLWSILSDNCLSEIPSCPAPYLRKRTLPRLSCPFVHTAAQMEWTIYCHIATSEWLFMVYKSVYKALGAPLWWKMPATCNLLSLGGRKLCLVNYISS